MASKINDTEGRTETISEMDIEEIELRYKLIEPQKIQLDVIQQAYLQHMKYCPLIPSRFSRFLLKSPKESKKRVPESIPTPPWGCIGISCSENLLDLKI
jgi:hypothetical protein